MSFTVGGNELPKKKTPIPGRVHPTESSFDHYRTCTYEKARKDGTVGLIKLRGIVGDDRPVRSWGLTFVSADKEEIRKHRDTSVRPRSLRGSTHAPAKVEHFIRTKSALDDQLDTPAEPFNPTNHHLPMPTSGKRRLVKSIRAMRNR